jgi:hypothetical protein
VKPVRFSATPEVPHVLWNRKIHNPIHNSPTVGPCLSQMNSVYILNPFSLRSLVLLLFHLLFGLISSLFHSGFVSKTLHTCISVPTHAVCPVHLIRPGVLTLILFASYYEVFSSLLFRPPYGEMCSWNTVRTHWTLCMRKSSQGCQSVYVFIYLFNRWTFMNFSQFLSRITDWSLNYRVSIPSKCRILCPRPWQFFDSATRLSVLLKLFARC